MNGSGDVGFITFFFFFTKVNFYLPTLFTGGVTISMLDSHREGLGSNPRSGGEKTGFFS